MTLGQNSPGKDLKVRYLYVGLLMVAGLMLLAGRLYRLQITRGDEFVQKSVENFVKEVRIPADRGMILDRNRAILVDNRPSFNVYITPAFCEQCFDDILPKLSQWLRWDEEARERAESLVREARRAAPFRPVPVAIDLTRDELDTLHAHERELHGVDVHAVPHRNYRFGARMGHVLGYMNEITGHELETANAAGKDYALGDYKGRNGIEAALEDMLRGKDGVRREVVDARGRTLPNLSGLLDQADVVPPYPGHNVVLSIDQRLQDEAERIFPGKAGVVVGIDVHTGFIRVLMSKPSYDPNLLTGRISAAQFRKLQKDPLEPMINRAVGEHYSPGSTFKVVTAIAGLRSGQFTPQTVVTCPGGYRLGARVWRCWKDAGHGPKDVRGALQHSCDVWFYRAADVLGLDPISEVASALGFGKPTGIGVFPEVPGIMPTSAYHDRVNKSTGGYTKGMALNSSIGQGDVNVTPLQLVLAYASISNGGKVYRPQIVMRVEGPDGAVVQEAKPELVDDLHIEEAHRQVVIDALDAVVNEAGGTAYGKRLKDVRVAGKTGTTQVARIGKVRMKKDEMSYFQRDHAWFAAFAPAQNPELAIVVLNEHGGGGSSDAAPTAMAVFAKYFELKEQDAAAQAAAKAALPGGPGEAVSASALPVAVAPGEGTPAHAGAGAVLTPTPTQAGPGSAAPQGTPPPPPAPSVAHAAGAGAVAPASGTGASGRPAASTGLAGPDGGGAAGGRAAPGGGPGAVPSVSAPSSAPGPAGGVAAPAAGSGVAPVAVPSAAPVGGGGLTGPSGGGSAGSGSAGSGAPVVAAPSGVAPVVAPGPLPGLAPVRPPASPGSTAPAAGPIPLGPPGAGTLPPPPSAPSTPTVAPAKGGGRDAGVRPRRGGVEGSRGWRRVPPRVRLEGAASSEAAAVEERSWRRGEGGR